MLRIVAVGMIAIIAAASLASVYAPKSSPDDVGNLRKRVGAVMQMSEDDLAALVPPQGGIRMCDCPNCTGGANYAQMQWSIDKPDVVTCRYCGMEFPNEKYPMDHAKTIELPGGRTVKMRYHHAPDQDYYFEARRWELAQNYLVDRTLELAKLYALTGEDKFARRAGVILGEFARVYPDYVCVREYSSGTKRFAPPSATPPDFAFRRRGGRWHSWAIHEIPEDMIRAYDLVREAEGFKEVCRQRKCDPGEDIENGWFAAAVKYSLGFPEINHNTSPYVFRQLIISGRVLNRPQWVHEAVRRIRNFISTQYFYDGMWMEGTLSYHWQTVGSLSRCFDVLKGYSDPEGYADPRDGEHFEDVRPPSVVPFYEKTVEAGMDLRYPNARLVTINDTWKFSFRGEALEKSRPMLFGGLGHGVLAAGEGDGQIQLHLNYSGGYGHIHHDNLNFILFAHGRELIPDIGYTHMNVTGWTRSTAGHNTVMIDRQEQYPGGRGDADPSVGSLLTYDATNPHIQVIEAEASRSYRQLADQYRRMLIVVRPPGSSPYVVDRFEVRGGEEVHDWLLHGSADDEQDVETNLQFADFSGSLLAGGVEFVHPKTHADGSWRKFALGFIGDLRRCKSSETLKLTWRCKQSPDTGTRTILLGGEDTAFFLGTGPSVRCAQGNNNSSEDQSRAYERPMQVLVTRRPAPENTFIAVHEAFDTGPEIESVQRIAEGQVLVLRIERTDGTDYVFLGGDSDSSWTGTVDSASVDFTGRVGVVVGSGDGVNLAYLLDGHHLQCGDTRLSTTPSWTGRLLESRPSETCHNGAFLVEVGFGEAHPQGSVLIVRHPGDFTGAFHITGTHPEGDNTVVEVREDAPFTYDPATQKTTYTYFPLREYQGENTWRIPSSAFLKR